MTPFSGMFRSLRNFLRLLRLARILARHDALFPLEVLNVAPGVIAFARFISGRASVWRARCSRWGRVSSSWDRRCRPAPTY